jgi:hypothetical protein
VLTDPIDWSATIADWETSLKVAETKLDAFKSASVTFQLDQVNPKLLKLLTGTDGPVPIPEDMPFFSNHTTGVAMDINSPNEDWQPDPEMLEGSGDIGYSVKPYYKPFDVLGKASPVVVQHPSTKIYTNNLGRAEIQSDGRSYVQLKGKPVSTSMGIFELSASIVLEPGSAEMAKKLIGVIPNDGPGTGVQLLEKSAGNQLFTWEAGTGWVPKENPQPLHTEFMGVPPYSEKISWSAEKAHWPVDGTRHLGPDGTVWEFHISGGWIIAQVPDLLFSAGTELRAPYGWWCSACGEHWDVHKGDPVGCESGGWLRPATSAEHKAMTL